MSSALVASLLVLPAAAWLPQAPLLDRRAVLSATAAAGFALPLPAVAKSKKKAAEEAVQKETAKEAKQAMKEYKYAPRPELVRNADGSYSYVEGTVKEGSIGEVAGYFKEKGAIIQSEYAADKARAAGMTTAEAEKVKKETLARIEKVKAEAKAERSKMGEDAKRIEEYCKDKKDLRDPQGRLMCR